MVDSIRIDKYLWCVRLCKTRSVAADLCKKGRVRINDESVKPSKEVKVGEEFSIHNHGIVRTFKIVAMLHTRVGAKLVANFLEDLTPQSEYDKLKVIGQGNFEVRDRGAGRPTKRDRREIDRMKEGDI